MISNLKKAFRKGTEYHIPKEIINQMSAKLPEGLKYAQLGESDFVRVVPSDDSEMRIKVKAMLPQALDNWGVSTPEEYFEMMYRTQTPIEIEDGGTFIINGKEVSSPDLTKRLFGPQIKNSSYQLVPHEFAPPFEVELKGDGLTKTLLVRQQPLADLKQMKFQNVDDSAIEISFIYQNETRKMIFTININVEKISSVQEMLNDLQLYDAIAEGRGEFLGNELPPIVENKVYQDSIKELLRYWEKIKELEDSLEVTFELKLPLEKDDALVLAELYRCLVEKKPFKESLKNTSLSTTPSPDFDMRTLFNKESLSINYTNFIKFEVLGCKFDIYACHALFDIKVTEITDDPQGPGDIKIALDHEDGKRMYMSTMYFRTQEEAQVYAEEHGEELKAATNVKM